MCQGLRKPCQVRTDAAHHFLNSTDDQVQQSLTWGAAPAYLEGGKNTFWHKEQAHLTCFPLRHTPFPQNPLHKQANNENWLLFCHSYIMPVFTPQLKLFNTEMANVGSEERKRRKPGETKNLDNLHQIDPSSFLSLHLFICLSFSNL